MSSSTSSVVSPDAVAVLVLIESSGMMQTLWEHIAEYYLPLLLNTIRSSNRSVSVRLSLSLYGLKLGFTNRLSDARLLADNSSAF